MNQKVGIIVGTDHHSFPSAVKNCASAGIFTIFHHVGIMEGTVLPAPWGYLDAFKLGKISLSYPPPLLSLVQALPARYTVSDCCFTGMPALPGSSQPGWLDAFRLNLGSTETLRVVFIPFHNPGVWRITEREIRGGFQAINFETRQFPGRNPEGRPKYEHTLVISPGDCRRHNFCALDMLAGKVSGLSCE
jgi:hypothetical protein